MPESLNTQEISVDESVTKSNKFDEAFIETRPKDSFRITVNRLKRKKYNGNVNYKKYDDSSDEEHNITNTTQPKLLIKCKNVICNWNDNISTSLEIEDLEINTGKTLCL